jgi:hypothetical protein
MRKSTILGIFLVMMFVPVYFSRQILGLAGYECSLQASRGIVGLIALVPALTVLSLLILFNRKIQDFRGRDIDEEERLESDHGMIRLSPNETRPDDLPRDSRSPPHRQRPRRVRRRLKKRARGRPPRRRTPWLRRPHKQTRPLLHALPIRSPQTPDRRRQH